MITIHLNGKTQESPQGMTLSSLVEFLKLPGDRVAVELNLEIVPRRAWDQTVLRTGDRLEVVHFVGGGLESVP